MFNATQGPDMAKEHDVSGELLSLNCQLNEIEEPYEM